MALVAVLTAAFLLVSPAGPAPRTVALWFVAGVLIPVGFAIVLLRHRTLRVVRLDVCGTFVFALIGLVLAPIADWPLGLAAMWLLATIATGGLVYLLRSA